MKRKYIVEGNIAIFCSYEVLSVTNCLATKSLSIIAPVEVFTYSEAEHNRFRNMLLCKNKIFIENTTVSDVARRKKCFHFAILSLD